MSPPRVLIVAEQCSARGGGESILPYHWFRLLRARGVEAWMITHARNGPEIAAVLPGEAGRVHLIPDTRLHKTLWRLGRRLPDKIAFFTTNLALRLWTQTLARRTARRLVREHGVTVVHQPIPVSPRDPSLLFGLGAPVVVGPLNGGMSYPPAFSGMESGLVRRTVGAARGLATLANALVPGKRRAAVVLVANERTRAALPGGVGGGGRAEVFVENGVDLSLWTPDPARGPARAGGAPLRVAFVGRCIPLKGVDLLLEAVAPAVRRGEVTLEIIGDGPARRAWEGVAARLGLAPPGVAFAGFLPQAEVAARLKRADVLALPSLHECGGAVVLEAMACGVACVVTDWGGPADYVDASCGVLVKPEGPGAFVAGLRSAIERLAADPAETRRLGEAGRRRILEQGFDWDGKLERMLAVYERAAGRAGTNGG